MSPPNRVEPPARPPESPAERAALRSGAGRPSRESLEMRRAAEDGAAPSDPLRLQDALRTLERTVPQRIAGRVTELTGLVLRATAPGARVAPATEEVETVGELLRRARELLAELAFEGLHHFAHAVLDAAPDVEGVAALDPLP